jgi:hypothetical protein
VKERRSTRPSYHFEGSGPKEREPSIKEGGQVKDDRAIERSSDRGGQRAGREASCK